MNNIKKYEPDEKYKLKVYIGNYNKSEFYSIMGKFFAEREYKKKLPYLINDTDKIWYLIYQKEKFVGFFGIKICLENTLISDIYIHEEFSKLEVFEYMAKYLVNIYDDESLKILTKFSDEQNILFNLGFQAIGTRGNYLIMIRGSKKCQK